MNKIARAIIMVITVSLLTVSCNMGKDDFLTHKQQQSPSKDPRKVLVVKDDKDDLVAQNSRLNLEKAAALKRASEAEAREKETSNKLSQSSTFISDLIVEISKKDRKIGALENKLANAQAGRHTAEQQLKGAQKVAAITVRTAVAIAKTKTHAHARVKHTAKKP